MSDINRIGIQQPDIRIKSGRPKKEPAGSGKTFENQLLETFNKLKSLDNKVEAMMESTKPQKGEELDASLQLKNSKDDIMAENFSAARKASAKSVNSVAVHYEQALRKK